MSPPRRNSAPGYPRGLAIAGLPATITGVDRPCDSCGCALAADNPGSRCSPCEAAALRPRRASGPVLANGVRVVVAAWDDGFPAFCDAADLAYAPAADLAVRLGLIPASWSLSAARLADLADGRSVTDTDFARRWGVNRRTVAVWRQALGLERVPVSRRYEAAPPDAVSDVEVTIAETTRLDVHGIRVRLGRSARSFLEQLAHRHPDPVPDADLRRAVFPDADGQRAQAALHATVSRLRRHLPENTVVREPDGYRLNIPGGSIV